MNKKKAVSINQKTLEIAKSTTGSRLILYVWVAINRFLHDEESQPSLKQLADECGCKRESLNKAIQWLEENGYLQVISESNKTKTYVV